MHARMPAAWLLLLSVLVLVLVAACTPGEEPGAADGSGDDAPVDEEAEAQDPADSGDAEDSGDVRDGGTVVWAFDQEPSTLNTKIFDGNLYAASQIALSTMLPLWVITPDFEYEPSPLLADWNVNQEGDPFSVTYELAEEAEYSDGEPVTAADLYYTLEICNDEDADITSDAGCEEVDMEATAEGMDPDSKVLEVIYTEPYAAWQTLFSTADGIVLPEHLLGDIRGEDFNALWQDGIVDPATGDPISSGPFLFESWERGQQLEIVRDEDWFGGEANLERIVFRFVPELATQVQQLAGGEADLIDPQPELDLVDQVEDLEEVDYQFEAGPVWELILFQHDHPLLGERFVRQAFANAIDRELLVQEFVEPMYPEAEPLNSLMFVANQDAYEDHFGDVVQYDPESSIQLLEENGCERGDDDVFVCDGERMEFGYTSTTGVERRELMFQVIEQQLAEVGIEVNDEFADPAAVFSADVIEAGDFDVFNLGFVGTPDPEDNVELWRCDGAQNYHNHCPDEAVNETLLETRRTIDPEERSAMFNEAGREIAEAIPVLPLFQTPHFVAYDSDLTGIRVNPTQWGQTWNVAEWGWPAQ